ncbi:MAG: hypothetical protein MUO19_00660 [Dehalococcoidales bacterium]|nr:hypothetical protein [Dehalococcoidales bacterium]
MSVSKRCVLLCTVVTLVLVSGLTAGCQASGNRTIADMMKVLPEDTDTLFVFSHERIQQVPQMLEIWEGLVEETSSTAYNPSGLGVAAIDGDLVCVLLTYDTFPEIPASVNGTVSAPRAFNEVELTARDDYWESFRLDDVEIITLSENTDDYIDSILNRPSVMYDNADFTRIAEESLTGLFVIVIKGFPIADNSGVLGLSLNTLEEADGVLVVSGIIDFQIEEKAASAIDALNSFLTEECGVSSLESRQKGGVIEISGEIGSVNFNEFMDALTRYL